jgi:ATP-dependent Clp protease ATP-binding subunit ClpA
MSELETKMPEVEQKLADKLGAMGVTVAAPDGNTILLTDVPLDARCFSKPKTNMLIKRPRAGMPCLVCVDDDLKYTGDNQMLVSMFATGDVQQGWHALFVARGTEDMQGAIEQAFSALQIPIEGQPSGPRAGGLLGAFGTDLNERIADGQVEPTIGRDDEVDEIVAGLLRWNTAMAVVAGGAGVGKSNLLYGVARRLSSHPSGLRVFAVDMAEIFAGTLFPSEREGMLSGLLKEAQRMENVVLAIDHIDLAVADLAQGSLLLARAVDSGVRIVGTVLPDALPRILRGPLARRSNVVPLDEPTLHQTAEILMGLRDAIQERHGVEISDAIVRGCVKAAQELPGNFPARAIRLMDAAAARASLAGAEVMGIDDICLAVSRADGGGW